MRRRAAALLVLALFPSNALAGSTPAWVETANAVATPAWASGAGAVVLTDQQTVTVRSSGRVVERTRHAVRILSTGSSDRAAGLVYYLRNSGDVTSFEAWQIEPDRPTHHLGRKDATEISAAGPWTLYSEARALVLTAVAPRVGTVFAYESVVESTPLFASWVWSFDDDQPVLGSMFSFELPVGLEPIPHLGTGKAPEASRDGNTWRWELRDLPAKHHEPLAPLPADDGAKLFVSIRSAADAGPDAKVPGASFASWSDVARWLDRIESPQAVVTPEITRRVQDVAGALSDTLARIRALARDVQRTRYIAIDVGLGRGWGYRPNPAGAVLAVGYGDCKDKSNLLCTLLRADGHHAWMVSAYSGNRDYVINGWPSPSQFNHCITAIRVPRGTALPAVIEHPTLGTLLIFDPTDPLTAFGDLPDQEQGSLALIDDPMESNLVPLPVPPLESQRFERAIDATLSPDGRLTAHLAERSAGQSAVVERQFHESSTEAAYRGALERWLATDGASVELKSVRTGGDSLAGTFELDLDFAAPLFARTMGGHMLTFRPALVTRRSPRPLPDSARSRPIVLPATCFRETVTVRIPEGYAADDLPPAVDKATDFGSLHAEWAVAGGTLRFVRSEQVTLSRLPASRYAEVRAFYALVNKVRNLPVVLVRP